MADGFPCPNPACTHQFLHAEVKGASSLTCPRCGTIFRFRPSSGAPASPAAAAMPRAVVQPPVAPRAMPGGLRASQVDVELLAGPTPPAAIPVAGPPAAGPAEGIVPASVVERHRRKDPGSRLSLVMGLLVAGIVVAMILGGYFMFMNRNSRGLSTSAGNPGEPGEAAHTINAKVWTLDKRHEQAFRLILPPDTWKVDKTKTGLRPLVALRRSDPDVWLAVAAQDYGVHRPRDAELMQQAMGRLEKYFGDNLELAARPEAREFVGEPAQVLEFKGMANSAVWHGECYALTHHGIGYWLFVAAPTVAQARAALAELQQTRGKGFMPITDREGRTEQPLPTETFKGDRCELSATEGVWTKFRASDEDERGDLLLLGRDRKEADDIVKNVKNATILVLVFDKAAASLNDALKLARDHVEAKYKAENKDYTLAPANDQHGPELETIAGLPGKVAALKLLSGADPRKYVLLAVTQDTGKVYALRGECNWEHRQVWQSDFRDLLKTFRLKKAD
jgi:hypothetical protein